MGMRETFQLLESLGGRARTKDIRDVAKAIGYDTQGIVQELRKLRAWKMVDNVPIKPGVKIDDIIWFTTGEKMSWNVIT